MHPSTFSQASHPLHVTQSRQILRLPDVERRIGFKRAHIYSLMGRGLFPHSVSLGPRAVGWDSIAVDQWIQDRISGEPCLQAGLKGEIQ